MDNNYLITGYWGEPHVTVENDRGVNAAIFGAGRFVFPIGNQFRAEYIGNNTIRVYDGKLINNGAIAGIPVGQYVDLLVPEAGQGMKRNDLIVFQYSKDTVKLIESGNFVVVNGEETSDTPTDPELTHQDILSDTATFDQMPMWRITVSSTVISEPEQLFTVCENIGTIYNALARKMELFSDEVEATIYKATPFVINVTENGDSFTADKTYSDVLAAYNSGKTMIARYNGFTLPLTMADVSQYFAFQTGTDCGYVAFMISVDNTVMGIFETFTTQGHRHSANDILDGEDTFAPYGLVSTQKSASTSTQLTSVLREVYQSMSDDTAKIIRLSVSGSNLSLPAASWFVTIYRSTDKNGYAEAVTYLDGGLRYTNVIYNGTWSGWKNRSATAASVAPASIE